MAIEIHEHYAVNETWADGASDHAILGSVLKYTMWSWQKVPGMTGFHRVAVLKCAMPVDAVANALQSLQNGTGINYARMPELQLIGAPAH